MSRYGKSLTRRSLVRIVPLEPVLWLRGIVRVVRTAGLAWAIRLMGACRVGCSKLVAAPRERTTSLQGRAQCWPQTIKPRHFMAAEHLPRRNHQSLLVVSEDLMAYTRKCHRGLKSTLPHCYALGTLVAVSNSTAQPHASDTRVSETPRAGCRLPEPCSAIATARHASMWSDQAH